jgi:hypothetical protein
MKIGKMSIMGVGHGEGEEWNDGKKCEGRCRR